MCQLVIGFGEYLVRVGALDKHQMGRQRVLGGAQGPDMHVVHRRDAFDENLRRLMHRTRTMAFTEASIFDADGQLCSQATGTFKYAARRSESAPFVSTD